MRRSRVRRHGTKENVDALREPVRLVALAIGFTLDVELLGGKILLLQFSNSGVENLRTKAHLPQLVNGQLANRRTSFGEQPLC